MAVMKRNGLITEEGQLPQEVLEVLQSLPVNPVDVAMTDTVVETTGVEVVQLSGAFTNQVYQISWPLKGGLKTTVLLRVFGIDNFFDRAEEERTFEYMSEHGHGPRLLGRFPGGRVEEFFHARTLSAPDLRDSKISASIAAKMRVFHNLKMPGPKRVFLWDRLREWVSEARRLCSPRDAQRFGLDALEDEIGVLERQLSEGKQTIGFCHNDLQYGNIMIDANGSIIFIDYEYASYNPVAYDVANHFCEMTADYHSENPHIVDYNKYPDVEERRRFVHAYLSVGGDEPTPNEIEKLVDDVEKYALANHLFAALWAIISEHVNDVDFDNLEYAQQRLYQYWLRKPTLLSSS